MKQIDFDTAEWSLRWNLASDHGVVTSAGGAEVWQGALLPAFVLCHPAAPERTETVHAQQARAGLLAPGRWRVEFCFPGWGEGSLEVEGGGANATFLQIVSLEVRWEQPTAIHSLVFGLRPLTAMQRRATPEGGETHWPSWQAEGFGVPCTGSSPTQSFWRSWDMGHATLPLGSFGPAMGTPYAAAFPRPLYAAAMGGASGWVALGPGEVPAAALSLRIRSSCGCLEFLYREDLWGAEDLLTRRWEAPLWMACGGSAYEGYRKLYQAFPELPQRPSGGHDRSIRCTWGNFKEDRFDLRAWVPDLLAETPCDVLLIDEFWQEFNCNGRPHPTRFPNFKEDLAFLRELGLEIGIWNSLAWVEQPEKCGLGDEDLLCGTDGAPRLAHWGFNPFSNQERQYCVDPSSEKSRRFLAEKIQRILTEYRPALLKLDFGYGVPGPDACAPRDPALRGERLALVLLELAYRAAKAIDPDVTILFYGLHPLLLPYADLISIDDLGDSGDSPAHEIAGHNQRCLWASLVSGRGVPVSTSSGYYWDSLEEILFHTAVVGSPGSVLGTRDRQGAHVTTRLRAKWLALHRWHVRGGSWSPVFLDADTGSMRGEPQLRSWARQEGDAITAAVLQSPNGGEQAFDALPGVRFEGRWAVISQDGGDIRGDGTVAVIPFSEGWLRFDDKMESGLLSTHRLEAEPESRSWTARDAGTISSNGRDDLVGFVLETG